MKIKRLFFNCLISLLVVLAMGKFEVSRAEASPNYITCDLDGPEDGKVFYGDSYDSTRGITISINDITPEGIVVVGQDEERTGVSFHINITSHPGYIDYEEPARACGGADGYENSYYPLEGMGDPCEMVFLGYDGGGHEMYRYKYVDWSKQRIYIPTFPKIFNKQGGLVDIAFRNMESLDYIKF